MVAGTLACQALEHVLWCSPVQPSPARSNPLWEPKESRAQGDKHMYRGTEITHETETESERRRDEEEEEEGKKSPREESGGIWSC